MFNLFNYVSWVILFFLVLIFILVLFSIYYMIICLVYNFCHQRCFAPYHTKNLTTSTLPKVSQPKALSEKSFEWRPSTLTLEPYIATKSKATNYHLTNIVHYLSKKSTSRSIRENNGSDTVDSSPKSIYKISLDLESLDTESDIESYLDWNHSIDFGENGMIPNYKSKYLNQVLQGTYCLKIILDCLGFFLTR